MNTCRETRFAGKVAVVTGGGGAATGGAICLRFAQEGAAVLVVDRDMSAATAIASAIVAGGGQARALVCDTAAPGEPQRMVEAATNAFGGVDILVNHAGVARGGSAESLSEADWDLVWALNVKAGYLSARYAAPVMRGRGGGVILFTGSTASILSPTGSLAYAASKAAVVTMVRTMAADFGPDNIRVNAVLPGFIQTAAGDDGLLPIPLKRRGRPQEIASAYAYLASSEASYITGTTLIVDGGATAGLSAIQR